MARLATGWNLGINRGPSSLFVRLVPEHAAASPCGLAEELWSVLEQQFTYRVFLELDHLEQISGELMEELTVLQGRVRDRGGMLRLCGLREDSSHETVTRPHLPSYATRDQALMGGRPCTTTATE